MTSSTIGELTNIFQEYFDDDQIQLTARTTGVDIEDWDSLAQVGLVILIEKKFGLKFSAAEIERLTDIGGMVDLIDDRR